MLFNYYTHILGNIIIIMVIIIIIIIIVIIIINPIVCIVVVDHACAYPYYFLYQRVQAENAPVI